MDALAFSEHEPFKWRQEWRRGKLQVCPSQPLPVLSLSSSASRATASLTSAHTPMRLQQGSILVFSAKDPL